MSFTFPSAPRALALAALVAIAAPAWADKVRIETSMGDVVIELEAQKAPKTVANFEQYVKSGFYDGTIFHRVIDGFMVQGGGMLPDMTEKRALAPIALETKSGLKNTRGTVAMARTDVPDSATAQFFINVKDNPFLDAANSPQGTGYAVFGHVISGMDVVDKIKQVRTATRGGNQNVPVEPVLIKKAILEQ